VTGDRNPNAEADLRAAIVPSLVRVSSLMTYDEFKKAWIWALRESTLPIIGVDAVDETLDMRSTDRVCKSAVMPFGGQHAEPFHVTAALKFRWDALHVARTVTNEGDMLEWLLGPDKRETKTKRPWLRVDVTLRASTQWGKEIPLPPQAAWASWARATTLRLERIDPIVPDERVREGKRGLPEILAWQGEPEAHVLCSPDGVLRLRGVELATWQAIETPRRRDDTERRPDKPPDEQLVAMFKRLKAAMNAWMEALDHLCPSN